MENAPGRSWRRFLRPAWIVPGVSAVAVAAIIAGVLALRPSSQKVAAADRFRAAAAKSAAFADLLAKLGQEPDPMAFVQARLGRDDADAMTDLIQAYAAWASRGDALEARRSIVKAFLENPNMRVGLEALLKAVALDTTPRNQDPMWRDVVNGLGGVWDAVTISWGRDLVHIESNPKTKDLLMESLASVDPKKIGPEQQNLLVADLIDLYPYAAADQKPVLERALATMAGQDVVEILGRRGINQGSTPIASIQRINQEAEASRTEYKKVLQQIEKEEKEAQETNAREAAKSKR